MDPISILTVMVVIAIPVLIVVLVLRSRRQRSVGFLEPDRYNTYAVVAFVLAFLVSVAAVVLGHIALAQIRRTHERGWGLAAAALILGYLGVIGGAIGLTVLLVQLQPYM
ncbi:DUF4190 domain-containing protein [Leucobacter sp. NPDC058333]|uniref:DUF4190 domain-containing protein n=1 Tax=Leucobacter sp. NPDC058333 TaxID=3346450 RepID=UPI00364A16C8